MTSILTETERQRLDLCPQCRHSIAFHGSNQGSSCKKNMDAGGLRSGFCGCPLTSDQALEHAVSEIMVARFAEYASRQPTRIEIPMDEASLRRIAEIRESGQTREWGVISQAFGNGKATYGPYSSKAHAAEIKDRLYEGGGLIVKRLVTEWEEDDS